MNQTGTELKGRKVAANDTKKEVAGVPYTSFKTLLNTADRMKEEGGAPSRVDRSYLANMPGGERGIFTTGLKALGLVNEKLEPTDEFHALIDADEEGRKEIVRGMVERVYAAPLALPKRATQQQLETTFRDYGITGSTLRRAISFFLAATEFAGIERSPNFRVPKRERPTKPKPMAHAVEPEPIPSIQSTKPQPTRTTPEMHPFIEGLLRELPKPGEPFPKDKQEAWFEIAKHTFRLIYPNSGDSHEAPVKTPSTEEATTH